MDQKLLVAKVVCLKNYSSLGKNYRILKMPPDTPTQFEQALMLYCVQYESISLMGFGRGEQGAFNK